MAGERLYMVGNYTRPTTAAPTKQPTGTALRTMLQLATSTTQGIYVVEFGISFDDTSSADQSVLVELFNCTGAATMSTALAATDVSRQSDPLGTETVPLQYSTALSGYATAAVTEGTVANHYAWDLQNVAVSAAAGGQYVKQWPLGREPSAALSTFVRVRVTAAATCGCSTYLVFGVR